MFRPFPIVLLIVCTAIGANAQLPQRLDSLTRRIPDAGPKLVHLFDKILEELVSVPNEERIIQTRQIIDYLDTSFNKKDESRRVTALYIKARLQKDIFFQYPEALRTTVEAAEIAEKIHDPTQRYWCLTQAAHINYNIGNNLEAIRLGYQVTDLYKTLGLDPSRPDDQYSIVSMVSIHNTMGLAYYNLGRYDSTLMEVELGEELAKKVDHKFWVSLLGTVRGMIFKSEGRYEEALTLYKADLAECKIYGDVKIACQESMRIANVYILLKNARLAEAYLDSVTVFLKKNPEHEEEIRIERLQYYAMLEELKGNPAEAYKLQKQYTTEYVALLGEQRANVVTSIQSAYEFSHNQRKIETLIHENEMKEQDIRFQRTIFIGVLVVLTLTIALAASFIISYRRQREVNNLVSKQYLEIGEKNAVLELQKQEIIQQHDSLAAAMEELKTTQDHLIHSEKMSSLGHLVAGLAHEINNPINFMQSGAEALEDNIKLLNSVVIEYDKIDPSNFSVQLEKIIALKKKIDYHHVTEDIPTLLDTIKKGIKRTAIIVSGLQRFARKGKGGVAAMSVSLMIDETLLLMQSELKKDDIKVETDYQDGIIIECRSNEMGQVFMNILMNAVHAIKSHGKIKIQTAYSDDNVKITIADNGEGMPASVVFRIFDPFFTTKDVGKGTGLGLSITHGIINGHGGTISVTSKEGIGTEFIILMPLKQPSKTAAVTGHK